MELDAVLILLLSMLAFASGKAGAFVVLLGALRYLYLLIHALLPDLPKDLVPSLTRKAICVVQVSALCLVLTPLVAPGPSDLIALLALALLAGSFARDLAAQTLAYRSHRTGR